MNGSPQMYEWDDIEEAVQATFQTWIGGGEVAFVKDCWDHFAKRGMTQCFSIVDETRINLLILALAWSYLDFCYLKWEEGDHSSEREIGYAAEHLTINPLALGVIVSSKLSGSAVESSDESELLEAALRAAVRMFRPQIHDCLLEGFGGATQLYLRMSRTNRSSEEEFDEDDELEPNGFNDCAYAFVENGFRY